MTTIISTSLSDHGCAWLASDSDVRSYDRDRSAVPAMPAGRFGALAVQGGRPNQAATQFSTLAAPIEPATKPHPGTHLWSPST